MWNLNPPIIINYWHQTHEKWNLICISFSAVEGLVRAQERVSIPSLHALVYRRSGGGYQGMKESVSFQR